MVVVTLAMKGGGRPGARWGKAEEEEGGAVTMAGDGGGGGGRSGAPRRPKMGPGRAPPLRFSPVSGQTRRLVAVQPDRLRLLPPGAMRLAAMRAGALGPPPHRVPPRSPVFMQRNYHGLEDKSPGCSNFLALVPWTPPQIATASNWSSSDSEKREFFEVPMESDETEVDSMDVEESLEANAAAIDGESLHQWAVATTLHDPIVVTKPFSTCYVFKVTE
uniref:Uncharacterized protein n=1 Tax=Oryza rufipogon TaxID=4529 RepID=A0A0E0NLP0_ORYRU